ncbi:MAG: NifB/NifX family molybdenum-iron cluster-binding protein, partial [Nanoarchaeota archaeon]
MKIAVSAQDSTIKSKIDQRFGRCKYFIIAETDNQDEILVVENEGAVQGHGAGIKAAEQIGKLEVKAIITVSIGPNATAVLE